MLAENPVLTTKRFIPSWRDVNPRRLYQEIESVYRETNRLEDVLSFIVENDELIDPATHEAFNFARNSPVEVAEGQVWDDLKKWANESKQGKAAWVSPMLESAGYPANKICFYEIDYTDDIPPIKILHSTTILFDAPKHSCLDIAKKLNPILANVKNPEFLRGNLFKLPKDFNIIDILESVSTRGREQKQTPSQETINYFVGEIKSGRSAASIAVEMHQRGIIGEYSISCPTAGSAILLNRSRIFNFSQKENWTWKPGKCRDNPDGCGEYKSEVGPCNICRDCQKEKYDNQAAA